jgi:hypothetical protein
MIDFSAERIEEWFERLETQGIRIKSGPVGAKLYKEAKEFYEDPSLEEGADVFISLLGAIFTVGWTLEELAQAIADKMTINEGRSWALQDDGTYQHT